MLKLIQHNSKSLNANKDLIEVYLENKKIDIAILSEIWLKPEHLTKFKNYKINSNCRALTHNSMKFESKQLTQYNPIEAIEITTKILKKILT